MRYHRNLKTLQLQHGVALVVQNLKEQKSRSEHLQETKTETRKSAMSPLWHKLLLNKLKNNKQRWYNK